MLLYFVADLLNSYGAIFITLIMLTRIALKKLRNLGYEVNTAYNELSAIDKGDF